MKTNLGKALLVGFIAFTPQPLGVGETRPNDPWKILERVTHRRNYAFVRRDGTCVDAEIRAVSERSVTLKRWVRTGARKPGYEFLEIARPNVVRVNDGWKPIDVVYSGKSSWADVRSLQGIFPSEAVLIITSDDKRYKTKSLEVSDTDIKLVKGIELVEIARVLVRLVYYIRERPMSSSAIYAAQESVFLDPELWPRMLHMVPRISVLLYDSSMPEDDAPVQCSKNPRDWYR
jgi:hypothetical protein